MVATPSPASLRTMDADLDPLVVCPARLPVIQYSEPVPALGLVSDLKIKPAGVAGGVDIIVQEQVVDPLDVRD